MGQPGKEGEGWEVRERRDRKPCSKQKDWWEVKKLSCLPMFSLVGVKEENGKRQKVSWTQSERGITMQLCVSAHMCACTHMLG